ncbi:MucBP domain-containing protein [Levilactobacillus paucivorans]|nr:MucBP domain-containing protein [Levilactobacillus paucivorans]
MRTSMMGQAKEHYKSYKAGKHWVYASITVIALGLGLTGITTAQADVIPVADPTTTEVAKDQPDQPEVKDDVKPEATKDDDQAGKLADADKLQHPSETPGPVQDVKPDEQPGQAPHQSVEKSDVVSDVKEQDKATHDEQPTSQKLKSSRMMGPNALVKEAPSIVGKNADEWMPDKATQGWVIAAVKQAEHNQFLTIDASNLYQYVSAPLFLSYQKTDVNTFGEIHDLTGLQYFTKLTAFEWAYNVPTNGLIDMSFAPDLETYMLIGSDFSGTVKINMQMSPETFMSTYLGQNTKLTQLDLTDTGLTGSVDGFAAYQDLTQLRVSDNQLTGDLSSLTQLPNLTQLFVDGNQLTGKLPAPANWTNLAQVNVQNNQLSGDLPDFTGFTGSFWADDNHFSTGTYSTQSVFYQTVGGKTYTLTPTKTSFDPITDVVNGVQDATGQMDPDNTFALSRFGNGWTIVSGTPTADVKGSTFDAWAQTQQDDSSLFTVSADPDNALGFKLTANGDVPDGTYSIYVYSSKYGAGHTYLGYVTFNIVNGQDPVDPVTPVDPTPGITTGTVTVVNVDENGNVISQHVETGTVGDSYTVTAPKLDGYELTSPSSVTGIYTTAGSTVTFTYKTSDQDGDSAAIGEPGAKPETGHGVITNDGNADKVVKHGGQTAKAQTGHVATLASHENSAVSQQAIQTTLPQTDEASSTSWLVAGMAVLVATIGLAGFRNKRHN